jgi:purine-binding chemotaxis protein CheW
MKKKRILYSELAAPTAAPLVEARVEATPVEATPVEAMPAEAPPAAVATSVPASVAVPAVPAVPTTPSAPAVPTAPVTAPAPRLLLRDQARSRTGQAEILLFRVANERFAIELGAVEEAIDIAPVHHVPEMPPAMLGVITVRGTLTSVYSPGAALGLSLHDGTSALIFRRGRTRVAIVVDEVDDVATLDLSLLRDAPVLETGDAIVLGVVRQRDVLLALLDADALIAACQAIPLLETA